MTTEHTHHSKIGNMQKIRAGWPKDKTYHGNLEDLIKFSGREGWSDSIIKFNITHLLTQYSNKISESEHVNYIEARIAVS